MNKTTPYRIAVVVAAGVALAALWQIHLAQEREAALAQQVTQLENSLGRLQNKVFLLEAQVTNMKQSSVEGLVRDANSAILQGWESLVDTVEDEIKKARDAIKADQGSPKSSDPKASPAPKMESPDGTERT